MEVQKYLSSATEKLKKADFRGVFSKKNMRAGSALGAFGALFWWLYPDRKPDAQFVTKELFAFIVTFGTWIYYEAVARNPGLGVHDRKRIEQYLWQYEYTLKPIMRDHNMLDHIPEEVWDRLCEHVEFISSDRGEFVDHTLREKIEPFRRSALKFVRHFGIEGGVVQIATGQAMMSIRQQHELGDGPFSALTESRGRKSNHLADDAFKKAEAFRLFIRDSYPEVFDGLDYEHEFKVSQGGFLYTPYRD